jgi:hypothetical protein
VAHVVYIERLEPRLTIDLVRGPASTPVPMRPAAAATILAGNRSAGEMHW